MGNKKVAVVGAGSYGLVAAKYALQAGLIPIIFEKTPDVGGMWNPECHHSWKSLKTNLSHYTTCFSDFPWKDGTSIFPTQAEMCSYLQAYSEQFIPAHHFLFNTTVTNIKLVDQQWIVDWTNVDGPKSKSFDFVIIATGFFSSPHTPAIPMDTFQGTVIHSGQYRSPEDFKGKRVAVVGASFSSAEISAELSLEAESLVNVISKPFWTIPRFIPLEPQNPATSFVPQDFIAYSRLGRTSFTEVVSKTLEDHRGAHKYFSEMCGSQRPENTPDASSPQFVAISDDYLSGIRTERISTQIGRVQALQNSAVILEDGKKIENIDSVIFCTGFRPSFPFFDSDILDRISFDPNDCFSPVLLHKTTFGPSIPGLAFVGIYRGPNFLMVELQARWVAKIFSGELEAVPDSVQEEGIAIEKMIRHQYPRPLFPHADKIGVTYFFAEQLGLVPTKEWAKDRPIVTPFDFCLDNKFAQMSLAYLDEACLSFKSGKMIPGAVFRALQGAWTYERSITNRRKGSCHFGQFQGSASFILIPFISQGQKKYLSCIKTLNDDNTQEFAIENSYKWEYNQQTDELGISLEEDGNGNSVFIGLCFLPPCSQEKLPVELQELPGWKAKAEFSLNIGNCKSHFLFQFHGINLKRMDIICNISGQNNYTSVTSFAPKL